jgi:hypothetical protein
MLSCGKQDYPPVLSSEEEAEVVMIFDYEGEKYELKYELYRHFFLSFKDVVDGGDETVWTSENAEEYIAKADALIIDAAAEIFSTLHHAKKLGIDPYSSKIEKLINEQIYNGVNGVMSSEGGFRGFGGDYNAYLASLTEMYLNYSAHILLYRYALVYDEILLYYMGNDSENLQDGVSKGALEYTANDVFDFYYGADTARVLLATLDTRSFTLTRAQQIKEKIASFTTVEEVQEYIVDFTATVSDDAMKGVIIGKYSLDGEDFQRISDAAISMGTDTVSEVLKATINYTDFYYILYKTDKTGEYYEENLDKITEAYLSNRIGKLLYEEREAIKSNIIKTEIYNSLDFSNIKMP